MTDPTSEVAPGVTRTDYSCGYVLRGRRATLVASGLVKADWLVSGLERNRRNQVIRTMDLEFDGRDVRSVLESKDLFRVWIWYTEAEREARERTEVEKERHQLTSPDVLRAIALQKLSIGLAFVTSAFNYWNNPDLPYEWSKQTHDVVGQMLGQLVHFAESAPIRPRAGAQAQDDRGFQRLMAKLTDGSAGVTSE